MSSTLRFIFVATTAMLAGCASSVGAQAPATQEQTADIERLEESIAQLEVSIEEQMGVMSAGDMACVDRCRTAASICDSAARICEIARDLAELEALTSCRRAESSCQDARRQVGEECACPSEG